MASIFGFYSQTCRKKWRIESPLPRYSIGHAHSRNWISPCTINFCNGAARRDASWPRRFSIRGIRRGAERRADVKVHRGVRHVDSSSTPIKRNRPCGSCLARVRAYASVQTRLKIPTDAKTKRNIQKRTEIYEERRIERGETIYIFAVATIFFIFIYTYPTEKILFLYRWFLKQKQILTWRAHHVQHNADHVVVKDAEKDMFLLRRTNEVQKAFSVPGDPY